MNNTNDIPQYLDQPFITAIPIKVIPKPQSIATKRLQTQHNLHTFRDLLPAFADSMIYNELVRSYVGDKSALELVLQRIKRYLSMNFPNFLSLYQPNSITTHSTPPSPHSQSSHNLCISELQLPLTHPNNDTISNTPTSINQNDISCHDIASNILQTFPNMYNKLPKTPHSPIRSRKYFPSTKYQHLKHWPATTHSTLNIPTYITTLDDSLGGGLPTNQINEVYGVPGSGTTTFSLNATIASILPYHYTQYFSTESEIFGNSDEITKKLTVNGIPPNHRDVVCFQKTPNFLKYAIYLDCDGGFDYRRFETMTDAISTKMMYIYAYLESFGLLISATTANPTLSKTPAVNDSLTAISNNYNDNLDSTEYYAIYDDEDISSYSPLIQSLLRAHYRQFCAKHSLFLKFIIYREKKVSGNILDLGNDEHMFAVKQLFLHTISTFQWTLAAYNTLDMFHLTQQQCACCVHRIDIAKLHNVINLESQTSPPLSPFNIHQKIAFAIHNNLITPENYIEFIVPSSSEHCPCKGSLTLTLGLPPEFTHLSPRSLARRVSISPTLTPQALIATLYQINSFILGCPGLYLFHEPEEGDSELYNAISAQLRCDGLASPLIIPQSISWLSQPSLHAHPDYRIDTFSLASVCIDDLAAPLRGLMGNKSRFSYALWCVREYISLLAGAREGDEPRAHQVLVLVANQSTTRKLSLGYLARQQQQQQLSHGKASFAAGILESIQQYVEQVVPALGDAWAKAVHQRLFMSVQIVENPAFGVPITVSERSWMDEELAGDDSLDSAGKGDIDSFHTTDNRSQASHRVSSCLLHHDHMTYAQPHDAHIRHTVLSKQRKLPQRTISRVTYSSKHGLEVVPFNIPPKFFLSSPSISANTHLFTMNPTKIVIKLSNHGIAANPSYNPKNDVKWVNTSCTSKNEFFSTCITHVIKNTAGTASTFDLSMLQLCSLTTTTEVSRKLAHDAHMRMEPRGEIHSLRMYYSRQKKENDKNNNTFNIPCSGVDIESHMTTQVSSSPTVGDLVKPPDKMDDSPHEVRKAKSSLYNKKRPLPLHNNNTFGSEIQKIPQNININPVNCSNHPLDLDVTTGDCDNTKENQNQGIIDISHNDKQSAHVDSCEVHQNNYNVSILNKPTIRKSRRESCTTSEQNIDTHSSITFADNQKYVQLSQISDISSKQSLSTPLQYTTQHQTSTLQSHLLSKITPTRTSLSLTLSCKPSFVSSSSLNYPGSFQSKKTIDNSDLIIIDTSDENDNDENANNGEINSIKSTLLINNSRLFHKHQSSSTLMTRVKTNTINISPKQFTCTQPQQNVNQIQMLSTTSTELPKQHHSKRQIQGNGSCSDDSYNSSDHGNNIMNKNEPKKSSTSNIIASKNKKLTQMSCKKQIIEVGEDDDDDRRNICRKTVMEPANNFTAENTEMAVIPQRCSSRLRRQRK